MNYETFIYLGMIKPLHMFLHTKSKCMEKMSKEDEEKMCGDVYCAMIHETMIKHNEKVLILNIDPITKTNNASYIDHISFINMEYKKEDFENAFFRVLNSKRSDVMVIKAFIENDKVIRYETVENVSPSILKTMEDKKVDDILFNSIDEFIVLKPIPYLK